VSKFSYHQHLRLRKSLHLQQNDKRQIIGKSMLLAMVNRYNKKFRMIKTFHTSLITAKCIHEKYILLFSYVYTITNTHCRKIFCSTESFYCPQIFNVLNTKKTTRSKFYSSHLKFIKCATIYKCRNQINY
jgi:hypothetical protein